MIITSRWQTNTIKTSSEADPAEAAATSYFVSNIKEKKRKEKDGVMKSEGEEMVMVSSLQQHLSPSSTLPPSELFSSELLFSRSELFSSSSLWAPLLFLPLCSPLPPSFLLPAQLFSSSPTPELLSSSEALSFNQEKKCASLISYFHSKAFCHLNIVFVR